MKQTPSRFHRFLEHYRTNRQFTGVIRSISLAWAFSRKPWAEPTSGVAPFVEPLTPTEKPAEAPAESK